MLVIIKNPTHRECIVKIRSGYRTHISSNQLATISMNLEEYKTFKANHPQLDVSSVPEKKEYEKILYDNLKLETSLGLLMKRVRVLERGGDLEIMSTLDRFDKRITELENGLGNETPMTSTQSIREGVSKYLNVQAEETEDTNKLDLLKSIREENIKLKEDMNG